MKHVNSSPRPQESFAFEFQGKQGGVEKNKRDDILVRKMVDFNGKPTAIFERVGNKTPWQKLRNLFSNSSPAKMQDVRDFLKSRGLEGKQLETAMRSINSNSGSIRAQTFEFVLKRHNVATDTEALLYKGEQSS